MASSDESRRWSAPRSAEARESEGRFGSAASSSEAAATTYRPSVSSMEVWREVLGPLLDTEGVRDLLGLKNRGQVRDLTASGRLLTLESSEGHELYPAFQFDASGSPYSEIPRVIEIFSGIVETPYMIASWLVSPQDLLEGETPAAWLRSGRDSELVFEAARRSAAPLAH
jgi:hypothetical protein